MLVATLATTKTDVLEAKARAWSFNFLARNRLRSYVPH
jgi:hypothetical protein